MSLPFKHDPTFVDSSGALVVEGKPWLCHGTALDSLAAHTISGLRALAFVCVGLWPGAR
jgi:hypothetical protein